MCECNRRAARVLHADAPPAAHPHLFWHPSCRLLLLLLPRLQPCPCCRCCLLPPPGRRRLRAAVAALSPPWRSCCCSCCPFCSCPPCPCPPCAATHFGGSEVERRGVGGARERGVHARCRCGCLLKLRGQPTQPHSCLPASRFLRLTTHLELSQGTGGQQGHAHVCCLEAADVVGAVATHQRHPAGSTQRLRGWGLSACVCVCGRNGRRVLIGECPKWEWGQCSKTQRSTQHSTPAAPVPSALG